MIELRYLEHQFQFLRPASSLVQDPGTSSCHQTSWLHLALAGTSGTTVKTAGVCRVLAVALTPAQSPIPRALTWAISIQESARRTTFFALPTVGWLARTAVPPDRVTYGTFLELADKTESDLRAIIEGVAADRDRQRGTARQIADLYASLMDQARAEALGLRPIADSAAADRRDLKTPRDLASESGYLSAIALGGPFLGTVERTWRGPGPPRVDRSGRNAAAGS